MSKRKAFTLIELLVVVAVVALLIGLLLPALASARKSAQIAGSLSNLRQIGIAAQNYSTDHESWPIRPLDRRADEFYRNSIEQSQNNPTGWNAPMYIWAHGGKTTHDRHAGSADFGQWYSLARDRPLNPYVEPELSLFEAPADGSSGDMPPRTGFADDIRAYGIVANDERIEIPAFRCPGDTPDNGSYSTLLVNGGLPSNFDGLRGTTPVGSQGDLLSQYEDVGTSYFLQNHMLSPIVWRDFGAPSETDPWNLAGSIFYPVWWEELARKLATGAGYNASRLPWTGGPLLALLPGERSISEGGAAERMTSNFGDSMKSTMLFLDGSAGYKAMNPRSLVPNPNGSDETINEAWYGDGYSLVIERLGSRLN